MGVPFWYSPGVFRCRLVTLALIRPLTGVIKE